MTVRVGALLASVAVAAGPLDSEAAIDLAASHVPVPPPGYYAAARFKANAQFVCPERPEPFTDRLDFPSKYGASGPSRDVIDASAAAEYARLTAPITAMEKQTVDAVKKYFSNGQPTALHCALDGLKRWAQAHALENSAGTHTGRAERKWALGSIAGAYIRLKFSTSRPLADQTEAAATVEAWLGRLADRVRSEWPATDPIEQINNHYYWTGWSLMAAACATGRRDLFQSALSYYRVFEKQLDNEGYLPNEMARASRALGYHAYALAPLTMIAAFAKANGVDLESEAGHALDRLAAHVFEGADSPDEFAEATGNAQIMDEFEKRSAWAWLEPYCWTVGTCSEAMTQRLVSGRPWVSMRLGGNLTAVFGGRP